MYTEDTFWDIKNDVPPSPGMMTTPYEIDFLPDQIADALATYSNTLWQYRQRELGTDKDTLNAYRGILNRINGSLTTRHVQGLPESILEATLA
jgi:septation ring formation regulator EzrA